MTKELDDAGDGESVTRAFYDIAQLLESSDDSDRRVLRVLERLHSVVPYEACAVLDAPRGGAPRLLVPPGASEAERTELMAGASALLGRLIEERDGALDALPEPALGTIGRHLAVPLIGLDEVVGVLFVRAGLEGRPGSIQSQGGDAYDARHVRRISVVAAQLAAYFSMLQANASQAKRTRQLQEARDAAEAANRVKDEFLAIVSHELRTPLNTILAWADTLRSPEASEAERTRAFQAIERSVRAEAKLIDDLLDLACIASATLRLELRAVEPAKLIRAAVLALRSRADQKAIRIEMTLDESVMPLIADAKRLSQVVANLVANAIKFTPAGGRVEVQLERVGVLARIRVIDTGAGISPELAPKLFDAFHQADGSSTRPYGGLGVGLALVKDLVVLHGGRVHAESAGVNEGATFTVELPLAGILTEPGREPPPRESFDPDEPLAGIRVLLVDDDRDICEVLQVVLEGQGAAVTVAASAAEALTALERSMPHVLLSDIAMPVASGHDLMRKIVARQGSRAPPAAALSAYARKQDLRLALASGFQMLLEKPIDANALIEAVATLAQRGNTQLNQRARQGRAGEDPE